MPSHTLPLNGRTSRPPKLTWDEAEALRQKGFRFSIFRPAEDEYRLSLPLQTIEDRVHEVITIEQG